MNDTNIKKNTDGRAIEGVILSNPTTPLRRDTKQQKEFFASKKIVSYRKKFSK
jgi:hypothetical protein